MAETPSEEWPQVHLTELDEAECWELLMGQQMGRIAWNSSRGPVALPITFVVHQHSVWIRTSAYSSMAREVDDMQIAVEVDELDPVTHLGWSVLVRGNAEVRYHHEEIPAEVSSLRAWPSGPRPLWVHLRPVEITGRRLSSD